MSTRSTIFYIQDGDFNVFKEVQHNVICFNIEDAKKDSVYNMPFLTIEETKELIKELSEAIK